MQKKEISMTTKKRLAKVFTYTGESEQQLEFARQNLCKAGAFEPYASFQRLDRLSKGYLTPRDFLNYMKDNGIDSADETDCKFVIKYFDSTGEGRLMYTDFLQMLLPCDQPYLRAAASQRPTYPIAATDYLPFEVERLLAKLIQKELKLSRESEKLKQELAARYDYSLEHLFKDIDDINYKYIDMAILKRFLIRTGVFANEGLLISILRRFDLDADAKLNLKEFSEGVAPQLDFSKRQTKEKQSIATSRVLSASKTSKGNKSFRSASKGKSVLKEQPKSISRNQKSAKKQRSQSKNSKSAILASHQQQQFQTIQAKDNENTLNDIDDEDLRYKSIMKSPSRQELGQTRDHSPLRIKQLETQNKLLSSQYDSKPQKSIISPKSNKLSQSYSSEHQRDIKSPAKRHENQDVDGSLLFLIRDAFKEILAIEGGVEQVKKELGSRSDFSLAGAFNLFTGYSQSRLTATDVLYGLERLGVVCDIADAKLLVERYDADKDAKLGFWEFSNALMPIDPILRDDIERKKAIWDIGYETKELLRRAFRKLIDAECMVESIRQRISRERSVSLRSAFDSLDWLGRGFLTSNEFKRAFESIGQKMSTASLHSSAIMKNDQQEMEGMIRRFNKDKLNGRISLPEFLEELTTKCQDKTY